MDDVHESPRLDVRVVGDDRDIGEDAKYADVFPDWSFGHRIQNVRRAVISKFATKTSYRPFDEEQRNAHQQETDQIGNDKCSSAILHGLHRKAEEVSKSDRIAGHSQD